MKVIELRRHTANEGDALTPEGIEAATDIGRTLEGPYDLVVSSGAKRATQAASCFLPSSDIVVDESFRSEHEDRWREIYGASGSGDLASFIEADEGFVAAESHRFADALRRTADRLPDGGRALVVGHSPMLEAAVWGVTGRTIPPLGKGERVVLVLDDDTFRLNEG